MKNVQSYRNGQFTQDHWPQHTSHQFTLCSFYLWSFIREAHIYASLLILFLSLAHSCQTFVVRKFSVSNLVCIWPQDLVIEVYERRLFETNSVPIVVFVSFSNLNASIIFSFRPFVHSFDSIASALFKSSIYNSSVYKINNYRSLRYEI